MTVTNPTSISRSARRSRVIAEITQPLTAKQLSKRTRLSFDICRHVLRELTALGLLSCRNPRATRSRLYWLTDKGKAIQRELYSMKELLCPSHHFPEIDWGLFGEVCYSHRSTIIKTLVRPMQPSEIKRRARFNNPRLKMSANNCRDAICFLRDKEIVSSIKINHNFYLHYELTEIGREFRELLLRAEVPA